MNTCSKANELKYDTNDDTEKHLLYKHFIATVVRLRLQRIIDYVNNPILQELSTEKKRG